MSERYLWKNYYSNENLVIGNFGEKARKLFEEGKISEGHYMELLHKIGINDSED